MLQNLQLWLAKTSFGSRRLEFYEDLAEALEDGAALVEQLEVWSARAEKEGDVVAPLYRLWLRRMDDRSFAQALIGTVPDTDVLILEAAEEAGNLPEGLRFLRNIVEAASDMKSSMIGAVSGFAALSLLIVGMLFGLSNYGIPVMEEIVPANAWPAIGVILRDVAHIVTGYGVWLLIAAIAGGALFIWSLAHWRGRARVKADEYVPVYSIYREFNGALFRVMLSALMKNKVSLTEALDKLAKRANPWLRWHIRTTLRRLDYESDQPAKAFATGIFNKRETWRFIDYGARSSFPVAIGKLGLQSIDKVTKSVKRSAAVLNKILLLVGGGVLGFIVIGMLLTGYEAQTALQQQVQSVSTTTK
ncbi:MAG TPA: type II secretion system F family protein [Noviherbaspirillum sp.]